MQGGCTISVACNRAAWASHFYLRTKFGMPNTCDSVRREKAVETRGSKDQAAIGNRDMGLRGADGEDIVVDARILFGERKEIGIRHEGQLYRLRKTRHGKLILNK